MESLLIYSNLFKFHSEVYKWIDTSVWKPEESLKFDRLTWKLFGKILKLCENFRSDFHCNLNDCGWGFAAGGIIWNLTQIYSNLWAAQIKSTDINLNRKSQANRTARNNWVEIGQTHSQLSTDTYLHLKYNKDIYKYVLCRNIINRQMIL